ncbi:MAG: hypothetical protein ACTSW1_08520 [Candidatus Hodarchaeales archaeon]
MILESREGAALFEDPTKKLQRAEYFLTHLIYLADKAGGLAYVQRDKQQEMRATIDGFFFELISAKDFFLQAINDVYKLGLARDEATRISNLKRCLNCKNCKAALSVVKKLEQKLSNSNSTLWQINNYCNSATHRELLHMGFVASTSDTDVRIYLFNDPEDPKQGNALKEVIPFCSDFLKYMTNLFNDYYLELGI